MKRWLLCGACIGGAVMGCLWFMRAKPPMLEHRDSSCWNNSAFQLLRNVRPLTEALLRARAEAAKKGGQSKYELLDDGTTNVFLQKYVDLLEIIDTQKEQKIFTEEERKALEEKRSKFHVGSCEFLEAIGEVQKFGAFGDANDFIIAFLEPSQMRKKLTSMFDILTKSFLGVSIDKKIVLTQRIIWNFDALDEEAEEYEGLSSYIMFMGCGINAAPLLIPLHLDLTNWASKKLREQGRWEYELIGVIYGSSSHVWAYIKDQFEDTPTWWRVDDMRKEVIPNSPPPQTKEALNEKNIVELKAALYKRVDTKRVDALHTFAQALSGVR